ncbi:MAG: hypothetical protein IJJ26_06650 [Victivallales bacterium]|nr:hypothetical protein [Victivallales bacterium]
MAPLYLLLFGGLLLSHDLIRIKNKILMLDGFVTVTGTQRFMRSSGDGIVKQVNKTWGDFMPKAVSTPLMIANEYETSQGKNLSNKWNAVYAGRVDVEYKLPSHINSLLSVQRIVFGDENSPAPIQKYRFFADPKTGSFPVENECRFHIIQRHWGPGGDSGYDRAADAYKLIGSKIMTNVLQDGWLFADNVQGVETTEGNDATYKQQLAQYAE